MVTYAELPSMVGKEVAPSDWYEVTQERVNQFAQSTGDFQWIHVDVERANREMGGPIAHGFLTLSLLPVLAANNFAIQGISRGINYGCNKVRFTNMVRVGKRVRLKQKVLSVETKSGGLQLTRECTVEIEGEDRPAVVAEWITMVFPAA